MRMLRVLHDLFYQPMLEGNFFSTEDLQNIFPSLDELIEVHCECRAMAHCVPHHGLPPPGFWQLNLEPSTFSLSACYGQLLF